MPIDAALYSGSKSYFFNGGKYIRVTRGDSGAGTVDDGYPASIERAWGWPDDFGKYGIDAALHSGNKTYFFAGDRYLRVTRGESGPGTVDDGYPANISAWRWPDGFGKYGIDAALRSGDKTYFFAGSHYIRVTRGDSGPGTVDDGYPAPIAPNWGWPDGFGKYGIDAALRSGDKTYFFAGDHYIRVTRGDSGPGTVDDGYPAPIAPNWGWPDGFAGHQNGIDAALYSGSKSYFFNGGKYIRVTRGDSGAGTVDDGYPASIERAWGWPDDFGKYGIDAALHSGNKTYFFAGDRYLRVTRGESGPGTVDDGYPANISAWRWPDGFGKYGIDAALRSGDKTYFFAGSHYIRVTRGDSGPGTVDDGYPAPIAPNWGWPDGFGKYGIDAALRSGDKTYFFAGDHYIRVTRGDSGPGTVDDGYPAPIMPNWRWPIQTVRFHTKVLTEPTIDVETMVARMREVFARVGIGVHWVSTETLDGLDDLNDLDIGSCILGVTTDEQDELFEERDDARDKDVVIYFVRSTVPPSNGCASHPEDIPAGVVARGATRWTLGHEVGHILGLRHVNDNDRLMTGNGTGNITNPPPELVASELATMLTSPYTRNPF